MGDSKYIEKAKELRNGAMCPNCAETILMSYAEKLGLSEKQAAKVATNFGGGMKSGSTCGVVTSSMMILGMLGITDPRIVGVFLLNLQNINVRRKRINSLIDLN